MTIRHFVPPSDGTHDLGKAAKRWKDIYGKRLLADSAVLKGPLINVMAFEATGNGVADDLIPLQNAVAYAASLVGPNTVPVLHFPSCEGFAVSGKLNIPANISVVMDAPLIYTGTEDITALEIGTVGSVSMFTRYRLLAIRSTQSQWTSESNIGIQFIGGAKWCVLDIVRAKGFTIGCQLLPNNNAFSYNQVTIGHLYNNKIGLDCNNVATGWTNENLFLGGSFACASGVNPTLGRYGIRVTSSDAGYTNNNNNLFLKPSFELLPGTGEGVPILMEHGSQNSFVSCRTESNSSTFVRESNASNNNDYDIGYSASTVQTIENNSSLPSSRLQLRKGLLSYQPSLVFNSGGLVAKACYYDGASNINIPGVGFGTSSSATISEKQTSITLNTDNVEVGSTRYLGVFLDTSVQKRFLLQKNVLSGFGGRVIIRCYDSAGNVLDSAGAGHPYVKGDAAFTYSASYGKCYTRSSDSEGPLYFVVGADVKKVFIGLTGGTAVAKIRNFQIWSLDGGAPTASCGWEDSGVNIGTAAPTAGTWAVRRRVVQAVPTVGQPKGWVCTVAGTPGTWVSEGNL